MATWYISPTGNDTTGNGSQSLPWQTTDKAQSASVNAGDTIILLDGIYIATTAGSLYAQGYHSFTKPLIWQPLNAGKVILQGVDTNYVSRISSAMAAGTLAFSDLILDANNVNGKCFEVGDMTTKIWTVSHTRCTFKNATVVCLDYFVAKGGIFTTVDCIFSARPTNAGYCGIRGSTAMSASNALSITHTRPVFDLIGTQDTTGIQQDCASVVNATTYVVDGATGTVGTSGIGVSHFARAVQLRCPGSTIKNSNGIIVSAPSNNASSSYGLQIFPNGVNIPDAVIQNNKIYFQAPAGYATTLGDSTVVTSATITGAKCDNNWAIGLYYPVATPHGICVGRSVALTSMVGNLSTDFYIGFLFSEMTSGTASNNIARDCYGAEYYAKGNTAVIVTANDAFQTGKYARRNLGPFSVDSQGGVLNAAATFSRNQFTSLETDFTRIGSLANITINQFATYQNNIYRLPDTISLAQNMAYVGGTEGGRIGAAGYAAAQWMSGTAGSVPATNGTGTISISGEQIFSTPIAQLRAAVGSGKTSGSLIYGAFGMGILV